MRTSLLVLTLVALGCAGAACSDTDSGAAATTTAPEASTDTDASTDAPADVVLADCSVETTNAAQVVCAANNFVATLTTEERATTVYEFSNAKAKTLWSNLPGVTRSGISFGKMTASTRTTALALAKTVLTAQGYAHLTGVFAGDDYLGTFSGSGGGGGGGAGGPGGGTAGGAQYASDNYVVAIFGTPSTTSDWMIQIGGHHMAYNITYKAGVGYPVPHHLGVEPKASFTVSGNFAGTYQPLADKGAAMFGIFADFDATQLTDSYLSGQTFADVLLGPVEYGTGSLANIKYPAQAGVLVSSLTTAQQALVTTAIKAWVGDYDASIADPLLAAYTSADAYAQTYVSYAGPTEGTLDPDRNTTYVRIDGPRLWIELSCQGGVVIQGQTHFHTIYRDKTEDYGGSL